jgi:hypothetical protein
MKQKVWFDFGNGPKSHEEGTYVQMDAFIRGLQFACEQTGTEDFTQYDTEEEAEAARAAD